MTTSRSCWIRWIVAEVAAAAVLASFAIGFNLEGTGLASARIDPVFSFRAMDESHYGHAAARMVRTGSWATAIYLDRFLLNKPPLLMWAGAASMSLFGVSAFALRLPVVAAGALCCVLVYLWLRRSQPPVVALAGIILLLGTPLFHVLSRTFMTDVLLTLFVVAAMFVLSMDTRLENRRAAAIFGVLSGAAIMTKSAAGVMLLLILLGYWVLSGKGRRPALGRVVLACALAAAIAAPWHIYQLAVHRDWFLTEYLKVQLVGMGITGPAMTAGGVKLWFYLESMVRIDPVLAVLCVSALPWLAMAWRRTDQTQARLLTVWIVIGCACLTAFGNRATYYLLPVLPALALIGARFSPLLRGRAAFITCAVLIAAFGVKVRAADAMWGLDYRQGTVPSAPALDRYSRLRRANELVIVSPDDQYYSSVLDLPKVRYLYIVDSIDYSKTARFFYWLGIILPPNEFCALPAGLPVYADRLESWRAPDASSVATVIMARSVSEVADVIRCSPGRDFFLPEEFRKVGIEAAGPAHIAVASESHRFFLLSRSSGRRSGNAPALGAIVLNR